MFDSVFVSVILMVVGSLKKCLFRNVSMVVMLSRRVNVVSMFVILGVFRWK